MQASPFHQLLTIAIVLTFSALHCPKAPAENNGASPSATDSNQSMSQPPRDFSLFPKMWRYTVSSSEKEGTPVDYTVENNSFRVETSNYFCTFLVEEGKDCAAGMECKKSQTASLHCAVGSFESTLGVDFSLTCFDQNSDFTSINLSDGDKFYTLDLECNASSAKSPEGAAATPAPAP